jgi:FkbM family methyltransferase
MKCWPPNMPLKTIRRLQYRARWLWHVTGFHDAIRLALLENAEGFAQIFLKPANQQVVVRLGTSDIACLEQVFLAEEYRNHFVENPRVIVDAGANIGMATLYFAGRFPSARILAIEPEPSNFELLERNCGHLKNVTLIRAALWPLREGLMVEDQSVEKWKYRVTKRVGPESGAANVPSITIPEMLERFQIDDIDLLKLDIEGSEYDLFASGPEEWLDRVRTIAIELHDRFRPGCAQSFYSALVGRKFVQELRGENIFVKLR